MSSYPELVKALARVKLACTRANKTSKAIKEEIADTIERAPVDIISGDYLDQFVVDVYHGGGGVGFNINMNEVLANVANIKRGKNAGDYDPVHPKLHVNCSQSTADACSTAYRLAIIDLYKELKEGLVKFIAALDKKRESFKDVSTMARTCMQDAFPTSMATLFGGYQTGVKRRLRDLDAGVDRLYLINLGGTVIGTGEGSTKQYQNIVIGELSEITGLALKPRENFSDAAQNIDDLAVVSNQLEQLASMLSKIAKDLRLLSSGPKAGLMELDLPFVQEGSSFFKGKNNPVVPETVINCSLYVQGLNRTVQGALDQAELYLNVFEPIAAICVLDELSSLSKTVSLFRQKCLVDLDANRKKCQEYVEDYLVEL